MCDFLRANDEKILKKKKKSKLSITFFWTIYTIFRVYMFLTNLDGTISCSLDLLFKL